MVLEHLFPEEWLEKRGLYAFLLGAGYSVIGIIFASILFPSDPALAAVAFISLLILPELYKLFSIEERIEDREKKFSFKELYKDNKDFIKTYLLIFLGILLAFAVATMFLPSFQVNSLFREQLEMRGATGTAVAGNATFTVGLFWDIFKNNLLVIIFCFILSFLSGDGAIFFITWNASVWGTIFGVTARNAAVFTGQNTIVLFGIVILIVAAHTILEGLSYVMAAISGGVISKDVILEKFDSSRFWEVFTYNIWLLVAAVVVLLIGAIVETFVLDNVTIYADIIQQSYMMVG